MTVGAARHAARSAAPHQGRAGLGHPDLTTTASTTLARRPVGRQRHETKKATSYSGAAEVFTTESHGHLRRVRPRALTTHRRRRRTTTTTAYTPGDRSGADLGDGHRPDGPGHHDDLRPGPRPAADRHQPGRLGHHRDVRRARPADRGVDAGARYRRPGRRRRYSYDVSDTGPSVVTTSTINAGRHRYLPSETLYDSLGRQIETQTETADGGTGHHRHLLQLRRLADRRPPARTTPPARPRPTWSPRRRRGAVADRLRLRRRRPGHRGRSLHYAIETWETDTGYGGDYTTRRPRRPAAPPRPPTPTAIGQTSYVYQYHSAAPPGTARARSGSSPAASGWDQTAYTYTPAGQLATITDAAGQPLVLQLRPGRATRPRAATRTPGPPPAPTTPPGTCCSATDARGKTISYAYDADGRKTAEYDTTGGAAETASDELASWTYDTLAKGQLTSSTSYSAGPAAAPTPRRSSATTPTACRHGRHDHASAGAAGRHLQRSRRTTAPTPTWRPPYADAAAGGLPAETVTRRLRHRRRAGQPRAPRSWDYVRRAVLHRAGPARRSTPSAPAPSPPGPVDSYDPPDQTDQRRDPDRRQPRPPSTTTSYSYDNAGADHLRRRHPGRRPGQVQCFQLRLPRPPDPGLVAGQQPLLRPGRRSPPSPAPPPRTGSSTPTTTRTT